MKRLTRGFVAWAGAAAMLLPLTVGTASADPATPPTKVVQAGMRLTFHDGENGQVRGDMCTLGAVGTDSMNRKIGITAGHCNPVVDRVPGVDNSFIMGVDRRQVTTTNNHPVWDWRDIDAGPIGWIRYVAADMRDSVDDTKPLTGLDYMVIEFAPHVTLTSEFIKPPKYTYGPNPKLDNENTTHVPLHELDPGTIAVPAYASGKINAVYSDAAGNPAEPFFPTIVCNVGSTTLQTVAQGVQPTPLNCGYMASNNGPYGHIMGYGRLLPHDSGGPIVVGNPSNIWVGIAKANAHPFGVYTSAKAILADMNSKVAGFPGKGFQITNN